MEEGSEDDDGMSGVESWSYFSQSQGRGRGRGRFKRALDEEEVRDSRVIRRKMTEKDRFEVVIKFKEGN